jgi:hypothetical protein
MIVPGWPQLYRGQKVRGRAFLGIWALLLLIIIVGYGTVPSSMLAGLLISVHVSAALDVLWQEPAGTPGRIASSLVVALGLILCFYAPINWLLDRVAAPLYMNIAAKPFEHGDVLLVNYWATPRIGQVVLHTNNSIPSIAETGNHTRYVFEGQHIDRILAGPGDKVRVTGGKVYVNGELSPWQPLNPDRLPSKLNVTVPDRDFLICPTSTPHIEVVPADQWKTTSVVPQQNVVGRVYLRNQPLGRFWWIR